MRHIMCTTALVTVLGLAATHAHAQTTLSPQESGNRLVESAQQKPAVIVGTFTVDGRVVYNAPVLAAARIEFKPGSTLVFSSTVLRDRRNLFIFARQIVSDDPQRAGRISWEKVPADAPPPLGTAPAGADNGAREEAAGGNGQNGRIGYYGRDGEPGPDITIVTEKLATPIIVDVSGNNGGPGGVGESGGRGGGVDMVIQRAKTPSIVIAAQAEAGQAGTVETAGLAVRVAMAV
ncbi:MAG TPA: hypothetical protein VFW75_03340 [Acetobacteraceae bacterium]|nr:hypothetical protein [Acetobacteraceae bacterium]